MRTDLETARFGHELKQDSNGDLWFSTPRDTGCTKTGKPIRWNITKHSPAVSKILLLLKSAANSSLTLARSDNTRQCKMYTIYVMRTPSVWKGNDN